MSFVSKLLPTSFFSTQPTVSSTQPKKFLDHCIEELDPEKIVSLENSACMLTTAGKAMIAAYLALSIRAFIAAYALPPAYLPIVTVGAIGLAKPYYDLFVKSLFSVNRLTNSEISELSKYKYLQKIHEDLKQLPVDSLQTTLLDMRIISGFIPGMAEHPENLKQLTPLIAHAKCLDEQFQAYKESRKLAFDEVFELKAIDPQANQEAINKYEREERAFHARMLHTKIQAAFVYAVLVYKPDTTDTLSDLGSIATLTDATVKFFTFKDPNIAPITVDQVDVEGVSRLGKRLRDAIVGQQ